MTAVGVKLSEAPGAPSGGEVRIRIPSGQNCRTRLDQRRFGQRQFDQHCSMRLRVALGDIHLSGDIRTTRLAHRPGAPCLRLPEGTGQAQETANCTMTGLADQGGSEGESAATLSGMLSLTGDHTPWKDPL